VPGALLPVGSQLKQAKAVVGDRHGFLYGVFDMDPFRKLLIQMQVITVALSAGLLVMIVVVVTVVQLLGRPVAAKIQLLAPNVPMVTAVMAAASLVILFIALMIPALIERMRIRRLARAGSFVPDVVPPWTEADPSWVQRSDAQLLYRLVQALHNKTILRGALLEALGMLSGMAYLVEAHAASLIFMALSQLWLVLSIPTRQKVSQWLAAQVERLRYDQGPPLA
jgi:hypothetical protein